MPDNAQSLSGQFWLIFGERVKDRRRELNLTQVELSADISISRTALANIETGKQRTSVLLLAKLAKALKTSPESLIPNLADAEERLQRALQVSIRAKGRPKLVQELENLNISVEPESNLENMLKEVQNQPKKQRSK